jgi:hypothetical protein
MGRLVCFCLALALAFCVTSTRVCAAEDKTPDKGRTDARLDQRISISTAYDSLEEFCAKLEALTCGSGGGDSATESPHHQGAGSPDPAGDSRLQAKPRPVPVDITCDPAIKDHKLVVRVKEQRLREVMRQIAELFDFTWIQGPQEHPRYHLTQSNARAKLAADLRKRFLDERQARAKRLLKDAIHAAGASDDELRELARTDPQAVAAAVMAPDNHLTPGLAALDEAALDNLVNGVEVALPFTSLSPEAQRAVKEATMVAIGSRSWHSEAGSPGLSLQDYEARKERLLAGLGEWELGFQWDAAQVHYSLSESIDSYRGVMMALDLEPVGAGANPLKGQRFGVIGVGPSPWSSYASRLSFAEDGRYQDQSFLNSDYYHRLLSLSQDYGIDVAQQARDEDNDLVPEWARGKPPAEEPKPSKKLVAIKPEHYWTPELLLQVAEKLDINLVADCYWTYAPTDHPRAGSSRLAPLYPSQSSERGTYLVDANPEYALQRVCERRAYGWMKDGEFYRARNLLWFIDDPEEVPASVLNEWMRRTKQENEIRVEDYVWVVNNLTPTHAQNLQWTRYKEGEPLVLSYQMSSFYWPMKLYAALAPGLRKTAEASGLNFTSDIPQDLQAIAKKVWDVNKPSRPEEFQKMSDEDYRRFFAGLRLWAGYRTCEGFEPISISEDHKLRRYFFIELWGADAKPDWSDPTPLPKYEVQPGGRFWFFWYHLYDVGPDGKPQKRE